MRIPDHLTFLLRNLYAGQEATVQFSSVTQSCPTLWDPMNCSTPDLPVHQQLPEFTQTHVHRVGDAIQPSHPLSSPSPPAPNPSWEICMQVKKQQLELDIKQETGSKLGKEYVKAVYCYPDYLIYMQSTSWELLAQWIESWNQDCQEKYQPQIWRWLHTCGRKWRGTKEPLVESERGKWKSWLKTQHSKNEDHGIRSHHFIPSRWRNNGNSEKLYLLGSKITAAMKLKDTYLLLGRKAMTNLDNTLKSRPYFADKGPSSQSCGFSSSHEWMWELDYKKLNAKELMLLNCGAGESLQVHNQMPTSPSTSLV